jgi:tRNA modification GTPase
MYAAGDTIAAIATATGEAGIAIVRISGPAAAEIAGRVFQRPRRRAMVPGRLQPGRVVDPLTAEWLDEAMACHLPAPHTYTREPIVEIQCHGGLVAPRRVLFAVLAAGARLAEPGEMTLRAYLNGRIDLAQAEAILDAVQARSDAAHRLALQGLGGALSARVRPLRSAGLDLLAQVTATIDFPEDEVPEPDLAEPLERLIVDLTALCATADQGLLRRSGARVAIVGGPNVGKSSLLNALLGVDRAIVTPIPGTTRDTIEESTEIEGLPIVLVDTAGRRDPTDPVEQIGIARADKAQRAADLRLVVLDRSLPLEAGDRHLLALIAGERAVVVLNKADLPARVGHRDLSFGGPAIDVSATRGDGLPALRRAIVAAVGGQPIADDELAPVNARQRAALVAARASLIEARYSYQTTDLLAARLAAAVEELGSITGESISDDLLATIFSRFCIGK